MCKIESIDVKSGSVAFRCNIRGSFPGIVSSPPKKCCVYFVVLRERAFVSVLHVWLLLYYRKAWRGSKQAGWKFPVSKLSCRPWEVS